jgi:hypothetical protein
MSKFDYKPTPYWNCYYSSEFPYEHEVMFNFVNFGETELEHYIWEEDITETGYIKFKKKISEVRNSLTEEFLGYVISGFVWYDYIDWENHKNDFSVMFPIQKVLKDKDLAFKFYSDLNNYWMRAELEIQKEKQR